MTRQYIKPHQPKLPAKTRNLCYAHGQSKMRVFLRVIKYAEFSGKRIRLIFQIFTELCSFDASIHSTTPAKTCQPIQEACVTHMVKIK